MNKQQAKPVIQSRDFPTSSWFEYSVVGLNFCVFKKVKFLINSRGCSKRIQVMDSSFLFVCLDQP